MNNEKVEKNKYLVRKVSIIDTMRNLPIGRTVLYEAKECGSISTARSAACRLGQAGEGEWVVSSDDNGATYTIQRNS